MVKRHFLNETERRQISQAIRMVEAKTSGEIVTVIARESDDYRFVSLFWAALFALAYPGLALMTPWSLDYIRIYEMQVILFFLFALIFQWRPIKMLLVPRFIQTQRARRVANEQFFSQGLHHTEQRTGVLIFVSYAERYVEIIADKGINERVSTGTWDSIVSDFVNKVRRGEVATGFVLAIERVGVILQRDFPAPEKNINELADHLVQLD